MISLKLITCGFLHLAQHHGADLFWRESLVLASNLNLHIWLAMTVDDFIGDHLGVTLHLLVLEPAAAAIAFLAHMHES